MEYYKCLAVKVPSHAFGYTLTVHGETHRLKSQTPRSIMSARREFQKKYLNEFYNKQVDESVYYKKYKIIEVGLNRAYFLDKRFVSLNRKHVSQIIFDLVDQRNHFLSQGIPVPFVFKVACSADEQAFWELSQEDK